MFLGLKIVLTAWFSGEIYGLLLKGCRFESHSDKSPLIKEVNVPI